MLQVANQARWSTRRPRGALAARPCWDRGVHARDARAAAAAARATPVPAAGRAARSAAPYLSFDDRPPEVLQDLIWEPDLAPRDPYRRYVVLGGDGAGNPIALEVDPPGAVVLLDHHHEFTPVLMNSSIPRLVTSLLVFAEHVALHSLYACPR